MPQKPDAEIEQELAFATARLAAERLQTEAALRQFEILRSAGRNEHLRTLVLETAHVTISRQPWVQS
jgi:uncharacterized protein